MLRFGAKQILAWKAMSRDYDAGWDRDEVPKDRQALRFLPVNVTTNK
jgi:hypothetical protein